MIGIPAWVSRYCGIRYVEGGFDERGCTCWGLVRLVLLREKGIEVPKHSEFSARQIILAARGIANIANTRPWSKIEGAFAAFDVIMLTHYQVEGGKLHRLPAHVGIAVSSRHILHLENACAAVCLRSDHPTLRHRILGVYRHEALQS